MGKTVDYSRIKKIDLVISKGAKSIPLSEKTDLRGVTITVMNNNKNLFLFEYTKEMQPITVKAKEVDNQSFSEKVFKKGLYLFHNSRKLVGGKPATTMVLPERISS